MPTFFFTSLLKECSSVQWFMPRVSARSIRYLIL